MKTCGRCSLTKELCEFPLNQGYFTSPCKECRRAYAREYWRDHGRKPKDPEKQARYNRTHLLRKRGVSQEQFDALAVLGCAVCGTTEGLCMDHNHETGEFRGLLCRPHNLALGHFRDSVEDMRAAIQYLVGQ